MAARQVPGFSLALGSGGARGLAHIGVLDVLDDEGLLPRAIAGTSMGAIVGAMYAAGVDPDAMVAGVESLGLREIASLTSFTLKPGSIMTADRVEAQLRTFLPPTFADLRIPFACVAADLISGDAVVIREGDLARAVRASITVPLLFDPVRDGERLLVDGGIVDPVPVAVARELGGDPVIAVDVGTLAPIAPGPAAARGLWALLDAADSPTIAQVGTRTLDIVAHWLSVPQDTGAAVLIAPDVGGYSYADMMDGATIAAAGARAARDALPVVRDAIADAARTPVERWWRRVAGS